MSAEPPRPTASSRPIGVFPTWTALATVYVVALALGLAALLPLPVLYDTDSYYHLAAARLYLEEGLVDTLPWARLSLLHDGFGDKEILFHLALAPFAPFGRTGGHVALALLHAAIATVLAALGARLLTTRLLASPTRPSSPGRWRDHLLDARLWLLPALVYLGSLAFLGRAIRLRPEHGALLWILLAPWAVATGRARLLGVLAALYAWTHTALHAFVGLCLLLIAQRVLRARDERRLADGARMALWVALGAGLGLLLHPHFPHNLVVWKVQSVDFFLAKATLDVGTEIRPPTGEELLLGSLPVWLVAAALWWARPTRAIDPPHDPADDPAGDSAIEPATDRLAEAYALAFVIFGVLAVLMLRFVTFALPLGAVALAGALARRGGVGRRVRLGPLALPTVAVVALVLAAGTMRAGMLLADLRAAPIAAHDSPSDVEPSREHEWSLFGAAVPDGAPVAAEWGATAIYAFWAPQGRYLNVLDPVFMATTYPDAYAAQRRLFDGDEPDTAMTVVESLASSHLALSTFHRAPDLLARLEADPRWVSVYRGWTRLYAVRPPPVDAFVLDWSIGGAPYPRRDGPLGALEAFVDGRRLLRERLDDAGCVVARRPRGDLDRVELAATGPVAIAVDGRVIASSATAGDAVLGRGLVVDLPAGSDLVVRACPGPGSYAPGALDLPADRAAGFFFRPIPTSDTTP